MERTKHDTCFFQSLSYSSWDSLRTRRGSLMGVLRYGACRGESAACCLSSGHCNRSLHPDFTKNIALVELLTCLGSDLRRGTLGSSGSCPVGLSTSVTTAISVQTEVRYPPRTSTSVDTKLPASQHLLSSLSSQLLPKVQGTQRCQGWTSQGQKDQEGNITQALQLLDSLSLKQTHWPRS